ncbi:MAG: MmgE/PrpD family protein [Nitrososphaerales archaeon]
MSTKSVQDSRIDQLCEHVVHTRFRSIPKDVIEQSKKMLLDTLGAMIRASSKRYQAGNILTKFVKEQGGKPLASIIQRGFKTNLVNAALVNGTFGYYCDVESHHVEAVAHVAAVIVPTSLALSEAYQLTGKDLLTALVVGYDVETRVSNALDPTQLYKRGFHPSCVAGAFGAAAAAGSLLKLNQNRQKMAFGLAGCQASGLLAWATDQTENSRPFQMGLAARNGVTAALLAREEFGAPPSIFEGKNGLFNAFSDRPKPKRLVEDLSRRFTIMEAAFKLYSCCAFLHPGADALLSIIRQNDLDHKQIAEITLRFPAPGASIIDNNELKSHNAQYILPILAVFGEVNIEDILFERRTDPEVNRLSKNTHLIYDEELGPAFPEKYTSVIVVKTKDGKSFEERVEYAKGTPQNPVRFGDIEDKFRKLTARELSPAKIEKCITTVKEFDKLQTITPLINLIKG